MRAMLAAAIVLMGTGAQALEERIPIVRAAVLEAPRTGETRFLLDIGSLDAVRNERILSARIRIPLPGLIPGQELPLELYGLTTSWRGAVPTWTTPWTRPGGDLDVASAAFRGLEGGSRVTTLELDVTHIIRAMAEGDVAENGFMLVPAETDRDGFDEGERAILGALMGGELVISYRKLSALGIHDGGRERMERKRSSAALEVDSPRGGG